MKMLLAAALALSQVVGVSACNPGERHFEDVSSGSSGGGTSVDQGTGGETAGNMKIRIRIGEATFVATLRDNQAATSFGGLLPVTARMTELNGNEKYYDLPVSLPVATCYPEMIRSGDIMLFGPRTLVLFYKTFMTSYGYTRIGAVDDPSGLEAALGKGDVTVVFERIPVHDDLPLP